ncbi:MAG: ABC transporter substrate-binding protein [Gaiella sp.]
MDVTPGTLVGAYRLDRLLGKGSMGAVWVAEDVHLRRRVAVKVLSPELADDDRFRRRFLLESQLAASLEHPHIVPIYAAGEQDGSLFLAMRLIEGVDLRALLRERHHLDPRRAVALLRQTAEGLDAAHAIGLVHRDVKPANVLVASGPPEHAYLCDFGLAKHASSVDSLTGERSFVGTISYIAPEQIEGGPVDARADQYALACVLYECLTGVKPYEREGELQTLFAHLREDAPRITDVEPSLGTAIDDVVARALDKDPAARYSTCAEMIEAAAGALGLAVEHHETPRLQIVPRTFLIADVRGYTAYTSEHGDEAAGRLAAGFEQVMREVAEAHQGRVLEIRGDEALAVFDSARNALRAALAAQARFADAPPARGVGIGIDTGEAAPTGEGFRGSALNTAARLCSLAGPGDVLASETTTRLAGAADGIAYAEPREERVKGLPEPVGFIPVVLPGSEGAAARPAAAPRRRETGRRRWLVAALVAVLTVGAGAVAWLALGGGVEDEIPFDSYAILDAETGAVKGSMTAQSSDIWQLVVDAGGFWAASGTDTPFLQRIDTAKREVTKQVPLDRQPYWVAPRTAFGSVWFTWTADGKPQVVRFDARYGRITARIDLPVAALAEYREAEGITVTADAVWAAYGTPKRIVRIDPRTDRITQTVRLPAAAEWGATLLAAGEGQLWAIDRTGRRLVRIDPRSGAVTDEGKIKEGWVSAAAVAGGSLWLAAENEGGVWQVDRSAGVVGKTETGAFPIDIAVDGVVLYVPNRNEGTVTRIEANTGATSTFETGHRPQGIGVSGDELWIFVGQSLDDARAAVDGERVLDVRWPADTFFADPAKPYLGSWDLHYATGLRLVDVRYGQTLRPRLVPTGAISEPDVSADLRRYTYTVRPGLRFSPPSNAPVTASVWRSSIERALSPVNDCTGFLPELVGQKAYSEGRARHIAGITVEGRQITFRLTEPSASFSARLAHTCFSAVPPGTPAVPDGIADPIPSAGPYYVAAYVYAQGLSIQRNPNYGGDLPQRLDGIVMRLSEDQARAAAAVAANRADYTAAASFDRAPAMEPGGEYARTLGSGPDRRYILPPTSGLTYLALNGRAGPLRDATLRRAVALAVDRQAIADLDAGTVQSLMVTPGIPAHQPRVRWKRDLAEARALLAGRRPRLVLGVNDRGGNQLERAQVVRASLAEAGIEVEIKVMFDPYSAARSEDPHLDLLVSGWLPDSADPQAIVSPLIDPAYPESLGWFTDPVWVARIRQAAVTTGPARVAAYRRLDAALQAGPVPLVPLSSTLRAPQLFSERVGCRQFLPLYGGLVDLTQLCLDGDS